MSPQHSGSSGGSQQGGLDSLKDQAGEAVSEVASHLKQEAARREEGIRGSISQQADQLASALRSAKSEIDPQSGIGKMFDYAADSVGSMAENLKTADPAEMIDNVRSFARERPGAFLGAAALAGFAAARFFVASAPAASRGGYGSSQSGAPGAGARVGQSTGLGYAGGGQKGAGTSGPGVGAGEATPTIGTGTSGGLTGSAGSEAGGDYTSSTVTAGSGSARTLNPGQGITATRDSDGGRNG